MRETHDLRTCGNKLLLIYDGYACHIYPPQPQLFRDEQIVTLNLPSHLSQFLHPLDLNVLRFFKHLFQRCVYKINLEKLMVCPFLGSFVIRDTYDSPFTSTNIVLGFRRSGM